MTSLCRLSRTHREPRSVHRSWGGNYSGSYALKHPPLDQFTCEILRGDGQAILKLSWIGPERKKILPQLIARLNDNDREVRAPIIIALGRIGPAAKSCLPALLKGMRKRASIEEFEVVTLAQMGPEAKEAIPDLIHAFDVVDETDRVTILDALTKIDPLGEQIIPFLCSLLAKAKIDSLPAENTLVADVCRALGRIGPHASASVPSLMNLCKAGRSSFKRRHSPPLAGSVPTRSKPFLS